MFEALNNLFGQLSTELDVKKYKDVRDGRKVLQSIKVEAQRLRNFLSEEHNKSKTK